MIETSNVFDVLNSRNNPALPKSLAGDLESLALSIMLLQPYSLIVRKQISLALWTYKEAHQISLVKNLEDFQGHAFFILSMALKPTIEIFSDIKKISNFVTNDLKRGLEYTAEHNYIVNSISQLVEQLDYIYKKYRDLSITVFRESQRVKDYFDTYELCEKEVMASVPSSNEIRELLTKIDDKKKQSHHFVQNIMLRMDNISYNLRRLTLDKLTQVSFPVIDICIPEDDSDSQLFEDVVKKLAIANKELVELYQRSAELNAFVTSTQIIKNQVFYYAISLLEFAECLEKVERTVAAVLAEYQVLLELLNRRSNEETNSIIQICFTMGLEKWDILNKRVLTMEYALWSLSNIFSLAAISDIGNLI
jgi:hypothetical protein